MFYFLRNLHAKITKIPRLLFCRQQEGTDQINKSTLDLNGMSKGSIKKAVLFSVITLIVFLAAGLLCCA
jgi:hypothetical protein